MFKHNIKYTDYNGMERNEVFYFNLSKAELMEMELSTNAGVEEMIRMMIATNDNAKIVQTFKDLILKSYGIKSEDGRRFIKSKELREQFEQSEAYSEFFMKMIANEDGIQTKFINDVVTGTNVPNMTEEDAIARLKEMGYDTTRIEQSLVEKGNKPAEVIPIDKNEESSNTNS